MRESLIQHGTPRDDSDPDLCDVCYWHARSEDTALFKILLEESVEYLRAVDSYACVTLINRINCALLGRIQAPGDLDAATGLPLG